MLYLLLKEDNNYLSSIDVSYPFWKYADQFEAPSYKEALALIPTNHAGKYLLYEVKALIDVTVGKQESFKLNEGVRLGTFSEEHQRDTREG